DAAADMEAAIPDGHGPDGAAGAARPGGAHGLPGRGGWIPHGEGGGGGDAPGVVIEAAGDQALAGAGVEGDQGGHEGVGEALVDARADSGPRARDRVPGTEVALGAAPAGAAEGAADHDLAVPPEDRGGVAAGDTGVADPGLPGAGALGDGVP